MEAYSGVLNTYNGVFYGTRVSCKFYFLNFFLKFDRPTLDFLQIEFYIETRFCENQVTKEKHFPN